MDKNYEKPLFINCTPLNKNKDRYMKWNSLGIIRHFDADNSNLINVQFHDSSIHPSFEFLNNLNYNYADLSSNSIIFASSKILHCFLFDKNFDELEWSIQIPKNEHIKGICLGKNFIAIGTSFRNLRLFSLNGMQYPFISIPGPICCLVAKNDILVVFYYRMLSLNNSDSIEVMFLKVNFEFNIPLKCLDFSPVKLALSLNSNLCWAGFTDEGTFCIYDSNGNLKLLKNNLGLHWIEVGNLLKKIDEKVENIFLISVSDFLQEARFVFSYDSKYPNVKTVPIIQKLNFKLNLCDKNKDIMQLEEKNILSSIKNSMLNSLFLNGIDTNSYIKEEMILQLDSLFKLFMHGVNENKETLLLDSAKMIPNLKTIDTLINYSKKKNLLHLISKLNELKKEKEDEEIEKVNVFTTLPSEYSLLKLKRKKDDFELMPLKIKFETLKKSNMSLNEIDIESKNKKFKYIDTNDKLNENKNVINYNSKLINLNEDLLNIDNKIKNIHTSIRNPFKIEKNN